MILLATKGIRRTPSAFRSALSGREGATSRPARKCVRTAWRADHFRRKWSPRCSKVVRLKPTWTVRGWPSTRTGRFLNGARCLAALKLISLFSILMRLAARKLSRMRGCLSKNASLLAHTTCFRFSGLAFQISDLGFRVSDLGFRVSDLGFRVSDLGFRVSDLGFRVSDLGFRVSDLRFRVSDLGFRVSDYRGTSLIRNTHLPRITIGP